MSERTLEEKARINGGPLLSRLVEARKRCAEICRKTRAPKISVEPVWNDDYVFIDVSLMDAISALGKMDVQRKTCCFCDEKFATMDELKKHSAGCVEHPAVKAHAYSPA